MISYRFPVLAATMLTLIASGPALSAGNKAAASKAATSLASMDCAALGRETIAVRDAESKLMSTAMTAPSNNPQKALDEMARLAERSSAIQKQKEARRCTGAVQNNNDLGK